MTSDERTAEAVAKLHEFLMYKNMTAESIADTAVLFMSVAYAAYGHKIYEVGNLTTDNARIHHAMKHIRSAIAVFNWESEDTDDCRLSEHWSGVTLKGVSLSR